MRVTLPDLAKRRHVERRTVTNWLNESPPLPSHGTGTARRVDLYEFADWWAAREVRHAMPSVPVDADEAKERALKMKADRELAEHKLAERRREFVANADVLKSDERLHGIIRARTRGGRGKWAPRIMGIGTMAEATATLDALYDDILAALADGADELEADDDAAAA